MEIVSLSSSNYIGLSSNYLHDNTLKFEENIIYTENGLTLPKSASFSNPNDVSTNNYSHLFLTNKSTLTSNIFIKDLDGVEDEGFSTYLAIYAVNGINGNSAFLVTEEPPTGTNTANIAVTGTYDIIDNRYLFEIEFLDNALCYIKHRNDLNTRYLTVDYVGELSFNKKVNFHYAI